MRPGLNGALFAQRSEAKKAGVEDGKRRPNLRRYEESK